MPSEKNVKRLYHLWVHVYDPFRKAWMNIASKKAEDALVKMLVEKGKGAQILELGCGNGINIKRLIENNVKFKHYTGLDFSDDMMGVAKKRYGSKKNVKFVKKDLKGKAYPGKYDLIISTWVMSHFDEPSRVVNAYLNRLAEEGEMILIFLTRPKWYINFWFFPILYLFSSKPVSRKEIEKMSGTKTVKSYSAGITTMVTLRK